MWIYIKINMQLSNWLESTTNMYYSWKAVKTNSIAMKHNLKGRKTAATEKRTLFLNILQERLRPHITQGLIKQPIKKPRMPENLTSVK